VPKELGRKYFRTDLSWEEIKELTIEYLNFRQIEFETSYATYDFTITRTPSDPRLQIDIMVYLEESGTFIVEFKRLCGDLFISGNIFTDLKSILCDKISLEELINESNNNIEGYDFNSMLE
jgi:hypothetical protein